MLKDHPALTKLNERNWAIVAELEAVARAIDRSMAEVALNWGADGQGRTRLNAFVADRTALYPRRALHRMHYDLGTGLPIVAPDQHRPFETGSGYRITSTQQIDFHIGIRLNRNAPAYIFGIGYSFQVDGLLRLSPPDRRTLSGRTIIDPAA